MTINSMAHRAALCTVMTVVAIAGVPSASLAGECPEDQIVEDSNMQTDAAAAGVTDTVIASIDLAHEAPMLDNRSFRMRRLEIAAGGVVPWHSHAKRPAIIYIVSGEIIEYRSTCAQPIVHKAGDVAAEVHTTSHWWENTTSEPVVLLSTDIFPAEMDPEQM